MKIPVLKQAVLIVLLSLVIEILFCNRDYFLSQFQKEEIVLVSQTDEHFTKNEYGKFVLPAGQRGSIFLNGISGELGYLYLDIECTTPYGKAIPYTVQFVVTDEGHSQGSYLQEVKIYSDAEKTKYINAHSYGNVHQLRADVYVQENAIFSIGEIIYNVRVPFQFSVLRYMIILIGIMLVYAVRPRSTLYSRTWSKEERSCVVGSVLVLNLILWLLFIRMNPDFMDPLWEHHEQYHKLAVALTKGQVHISVNGEAEMEALENPYDYALRLQTASGGYDGWDTAFYNGRFYVYFGIVPVVLFYLPYYILTGSAFPTWLGVFIMGAAVLSGMFFLLKQFIRKYFPTTPFLLYVVLSVISGNCIGVMMYMLRADFYSLPILCGIAFSLWGLALWFCSDKTWKLFSGSLCMALVAGCRPQLLMGSFMGVFIFSEEIKENWNTNRRGVLKRIVIGILPFAVTAAVLMQYNHIRFGSPWDFGASYNLTNNDMTRRGFHIGRCVDGIFAYLFQFPNIKSVFPYVYPVDFQSVFTGTTIREAMFGGVLFINTIFLSVFTIFEEKKQLKKKGLWEMLIWALLSAVVIAVADAQLAGLLSRYYTDFLWLLMMVSCVLVLQLWESFKSSGAKRILLAFVLISGIWGLFMQFGIGLHAGEMEARNAEIYYMLKTFFG